MQKVADMADMYNDDKEDINDDKEDNNDEKDDKEDDDNTFLHLGAARRR